MKVLSVEHELPEGVQTNEDLLELIRKKSPVGTDPAVWEETRSRLEEYWAKTGTRKRHYVTEAETAMPLLFEASARALQTASVSPKDVDLVIYAGIGRATIEPAMASLVQGELGLVNASCFDVIEACTSWLRGMQLADSLFQTGAAETALIVNCECGLLDLCDNFVTTPEDVDRIIGGSTLGEASTATLLTHDDSGDWHFRFRGLGQYFDVCTIPLPGYERFVGPFTRPEQKPMQFCSASSELMKVMATEIVKEYRADPILCDGSYDVAFFHQASDYVARIIARQLGVPEDVCIFNHGEYANTASATVPLCMSIAQDEGFWKRGQRTLVVVGAAGVSIGFARFEY